MSADLDCNPEPTDPLTLPPLVRVHCDAEPPHPPMWMEHDEEDWYAPGCPICWYESARDAHAGCAHSRHLPWRRWKIAHWVVRKAYSLGITSNGGCMTWDGYCVGCWRGSWSTFRGRRVYVLGWPTWKWGCVLKNRHWPGQFIGFDSCTKCMPCPECGSTESDHDVFHGADSLPS